MTRKERRRLRTIEQWLRSEWPGGPDVRVRVERMPAAYQDCLGTYHPPESQGHHGLIRIAKGCPLSEAASTLIHEWTHYRLDLEAAASDRHHGGHTNEFYLEQGRIERAFWRIGKPDAAD